MNQLTERPIVRWLSFGVMIVLCLQNGGCGRTPQPSHGFFGIILVDPAVTPLVIEGFVPDSPAANSGLQSGDLLLRVDRHRDPANDQLIAVMEQYVPGDSVGIRVNRGNEELEFRVELVSSEFIERAMSQ
ncbi:MAG: PDZ domain-containing protein [Fuerstiella sp.]|nr:PDZ domain-containing protein [Fuerstiella sp.]